VRLIHAPAVLLLLVSAALASCSGDDGKTTSGTRVTPPPPSSTTEPPVRPAAGTYATGSTASTPYRLVLVVADGRPEELAAYVISCAGNPLPPEDGLSGRGVPLKSSVFLVENQDVRIAGRVTSRTTMEGTISARSAGATRCGVPTFATWTARCGEPTGFRSLTIEGAAIPVGEGPC
jgi:hypothetical protein